MINLLDMMVPMRSGSHRGVHAPGGVTYPAVTSNKVRMGTTCVCVCVHVYVCVGVCVCTDVSLFILYNSIFQDTVSFHITPQSSSIT